MKTMNTEELKSQASHLEATCPALLTTSAEVCWYAIRTRSRHEKVVASQLSNQGINVFLPFVSQLRNWSDRRKLVEMPLFPGYAFVRIAYFSPDRLRVSRTHGVSGFVVANGVGAPIPDEQISGISAVLRNNVPCREYPFLKVGQRIRIRGGVLDGLQGILVALNGNRSLVISVEPIQRAISVQLDDYNIEAI